MNYGIKQLILMGLLFTGAMAAAEVHRDKDPLPPAEHISFWADDYPAHCCSDSHSKAAQSACVPRQPNPRALHNQDHKHSIVEDYGDLVHLGGTPVISSPFVNMYENYGGSSLMVNYSSINKDLAALRQRKRYEDVMFQGAHVRRMRLPLIELSGELEAQIYTLENFNGDNDNDIDLTAAELDIQALITPWITGFMAVNYDNSPPASGQRIANANVYLDTGFITFGNLNYFGGYLTLGQLYMPFGQFDSYSITGPFNKTLFRTKGRGVNLGYTTPMGHGGFYGQAFAFKGDSRTGTYDLTATSRARSATINQYGGNVGYLFHEDNWFVEVGASYINNVTDANGMQSTSSPASRFSGFGASTASEVIQRRVPGVDVRGKIGYGPFIFMNEYTTTVRSFDPLDLTYNGHGARPYGYHAEGVYKFHVYDRPSTFAIAYDQSGEALGLNVPRRGYGATFNIAVWRNTFLSLEARHNENYSSKDYASGHNGPAFGAVGKSFNSLIGQIDIYF